MVIILAGGEGKRMKSPMPKVLNKIHNEPMLIKIVKESYLINPSIIGIVVGKHKTIIENTLQKTLDENIYNKIVFIQQNNPQGTGHALQCCIPLFKQHNTKRTIILYGDVPLIKHNLINKINNQLYHVNITTTIKDNPYGSGRIIEENNMFKKIIEEKDCTETDKLIKKVNCGIYSIYNELLIKYLPCLTNNNVQKEYYLTDLIEIINNNEKLNINIINISKEDQFMVTGVNTKEELNILENKI